ncbi:hypothetical protein KOW79_002051 [Hemibagrus wyckioides]|uniref:Centlein, centrosomal protein n=1 Tax=Hemibagrus wyckioides TaxID=337641 RepID=A0A9D3P4W7_9TELE|nr:hypothetical protein KOW79_002051 [Hemibagrus wyckioides]
MLQISGQSNAPEIAAQMSMDPGKLCASVMSYSNGERVLLLQEEVRSLSQELTQCQADKEFVWSLWKQLQAANPDLTQAVSLVVEREKHKAEAKDRKVLEILQAKDYKIQELEKEVTSQRQEVSALLQQQRASEEERHVMKKELVELQHTLSDTTQHLQQCDEGWRRRLEEQQEQSRKQEETNNARLREVQEELVKIQTVSSSLSVQLSSVQQKLSEREQQLQQLRGELQDLQSLYVQSVAHAGEQAELIQQLEGLNMDTQQILQSQERVHTTHTASYHKLYSELSVSYQALRLSEEQLRQRNVSLTEQLCQKEQQVSELQDQLQQLQQPVTPHPLSSQCSRSVSPSSSKAAEKKIQQLEELLTLKTDENEELRRAHAKRHDRLRLIQTNYRAVKEQLKEVEDTQGLRAEPWELRQENSDAVWNELAFFKRENKKLLAEKSQLEEELDVARVRVAMERATAQELRLQLHEEEQVLERKMVCLERETLKLREEKQALQDASDVLRSELEKVQAALQQARVREEVTQARVSAERDRLLDEARALQAQVEKWRRAETASRAALLRIRQEVGVLRAERDFHRNKIRRGRGYGTHTNTHTTVPLQPRTCSPAKDEWEDMSPDSDSEDFSDSLDSRHAAHPLHFAAKSKSVCVCRCVCVCFVTLPMKRRVTKRRHVCAVYTQRLACLQQQVAVLQAASRAAHDERLRQQHTHTELQTLTHTLQVHTHTHTHTELQTLTHTLQQQKAMLEAELEQLRKSHSPEAQQASVTVTAPAPDLPNIKTLEAEIKQLNNRLKSSSAEVSRQSALIKGLRTELHERDQRLKELQDKVCHCERDVVMKRQLVEDLRSRLKILQDSERSHRSHIDELERKLKSQCEEASNRKSFIESLKRRLSVATHDKQQCESNNNTLREQIHTKEQKLTALQARLAECERSKVELEQTAKEQMQLLTNQSTETIHTLQNKLALTHTQHQHLRSVTLALAMEVDREVRQARAELRKRRRERKKEGLGRGGVSKRSMVKAQSIAASILNVSADDLASILDTDQVDEADGVWMKHIQQLLQQQSLSAGELLDILLVKMKENRALMEELVTLRESH